MSAALALFGNGTFLHTAREAGKGEERQRQAVLDICRHSRVPFYLYGPRSFTPVDMVTGQCRSAGPDNPVKQPLIVPELVAGSMQIFDSPVAAEQLLEMTTFFANEALLVTSAEIRNDQPREIYTAPGYTILKPQKSTLALAVISCLIGLQVTGLLMLLGFIYSAPSWTAFLDAVTLAQIGTHLSHHGKGLGSPSTSGVVGMGEREGVPFLALGEPGEVSNAST